MDNYLDKLVVHGPIIEKIADNLDARSMQNLKLQFEDEGTDKVKNRTFKGVRILLIDLPI